MVPSATAIVEHCAARAALAGNPSDGYGGAVFAVPVPTLTATVSLRRADRFRIEDAHSPPLVEGGWSELAAHIASLTAADDHCLVLASMVKAAELIGPIEPVHITLSTTIPRCVGLAGSSAIVIATLRALWRLHDVPPPDDTTLADIALAVERDVLHIGAGLQDRLVQAAGHPVMMRFGRSEAPRCARVNAGAPLGLFVAFRQDSSEPSQIVHDDLRARFDAQQPTVVASMAELASHAERAASAYARGDRRSLGAAMDATFDLRHRMIPLAPVHVDMIHHARGCGAHANYAGSGGSIIVLCHDAPMRERTYAALVSMGCDLVDVPDAELDHR